MLKLKISVALLSLAALSACSTSGPGATPAATPPAAQASAAPAPKLLVFMVIDGLPMRQVLAYRDQLQPDGFKRFLDRGTWFADAHYAHGHTVTAAGHSVMLTGAYPQRTSIIGNEWVDPKTGQSVYCTSDAAYTYIDNKTAPLAGTSPRNLHAETVGDVLREQDPAAKVIAVSGKDRGAILPGGHKGQAYMFMGETGQFASSTYYMSEHPQWVKNFNAAKPADAYFHKTWAPLLPEAAYARSVPDGQAWQADAGNGNRLPVVLGAKLDQIGPQFYPKILPTPFGDELTLAFARAAIEGEGLGGGTRAKTDLLSVSLSSHDYVNHAFGPESRLSHDHFLYLDRYLQGFFQYLDAKIGAGNYVAVLTADHGFADTPEWARTQGRDAGRVDPGKMIAALNASLAAQFGAGTWVTHASAAGLLFNEPLIAQRGLKSAVVYQAAKGLLLKMDGIADVFTLAQLQSDDKQTPYLDAMRKSWHPDRAAPLQIVAKPGWLFSSRPQGSSHGTPYAYDTHVPMLTWGPAWVGQGEVKGAVEVADLAPTLAQLLHVRVPAQAQGRALPLPAPTLAH
ncbi:alkaline phosphatase family protein [Roseateles koreensis]|uniref:Alkaline phosphatase family protein n=1 Tax=Roseateles koreensis TaxID=2987526 RepID=A0ABT5KPW0_9BURK|nr:alkaline phosphatase family protein [Roseateles koreensis]MDC8784902.1 alkaline phosphatase family protein [Roseateles koreensis]